MFSGVERAEVAAFALFAAPMTLRSNLIEKSVSAGMITNPRIPHTCAVGMERKVSGRIVVTTSIIPRIKQPAPIDTSNPCLTRDQSGLKLPERAVTGKNKS